MSVCFFTPLAVPIPHAQGIYGATNSLNALSGARCHRSTSAAESVVVAPHGNDRGGSNAGMARASLGAGTGA